jgi:hypothetical protein
VQEKPLLLKTTWLAAQAWTSLVLICIFYCDLMMPEMVEGSDFLSCLWTAAKLFAQGRTNELYTPYNMTSFTGAPCDLAAHQFLSHLPQSLVAEYNYSPLVAFLLTPLTHCQPAVALIVFQILSLLALAAAIHLSLEPKVSSFAKAFAGCVALFPVEISVWIGQLDIICGVLIFAATYRLLLLRKDLLAGLVAGFCMLKPQFAIIAALLVIVTRSQKRPKFFYGCMLGAALFVAANIIVSSPDLFKHWLYTLHLCERIFTDPNSGLPKQLVVSLPQLLFLSAKHAHSELFKSIIYAASALFICASTFVCVRSVRRLKDDTAIAATMLLAMLLLPFVAPKFDIYNCSILALAGLIGTKLLQSEELQFPLLPGLIAVWIGIDMFTLLILANPKLHQPWLVLAPLAVVLCNLLVALSRAGKSSAALDTKMGEA